MTSPTVRAKLARMTEYERTARIPMKLGEPTPYAIRQAQAETARLIAAAVAMGKQPGSVRPVRPSPRHLGHGAQIAIRDGRA